MHSLLILLLLSGSLVLAMHPVLLASVQAITFKEGGISSRIRNPSVHSLECVGNYCGAHERPSSIQCVNRGTDDTGSVNWACEAILGEGYELADTEVICEGYSGPGDPYVTAGSCSVEYSLKRTYVPPPPPPVYQQQHTAPPVHIHVGPTPPPVYQDHKPRSTSWVWFTIFLLIAALAVSMAVCVCGSCDISTGNEPPPKPKKVVKEEKMTTTTTTTTDDTTDPPPPTTRTKVQRTKTVYKEDRPPTYVSNTVFTAPGYSQPPIVIPPPSGYVYTTPRITTVYSAPHPPAVATQPTSHESKSHAKSRVL